MEYVDLVALKFKRCWNFLIGLSNLPSDQNLEYHLQLHLRSYESNREVVECAVCLSKVEEDEEVKELTCHHLFHRVCLDRWVGFGHVTCPLCRRLVKPATEQHGEDVLVFKIDNLSLRDQRDTWWLR